MTVKREILINGSQRETRVAILEDDRLVELLVDRPDHRRTVGDIYLGRVEAVLPGIQAAFVDIGQEKSAFLHASDLLEPDEDEDPVEEAEEEAAQGEVTDPVETPVAEDPPAERKAGWRGRDRRRGGRNNALRSPASGRSTTARRRQREISNRRALPNIQDILKKGQTLPVQVTKEPISTKGCRVTAQISLPGRFLVYMPYALQGGRQPEDREPGAAGQAARDGHQAAARRTRAASSCAPWRRASPRSISGARSTRCSRSGRRSTARRPSSGGRRRCCSARPASPAGIIRDLFSAKVDALHVDSKELYNEIEQYLQQIDPELISRGAHVHRGHAAVRQVRHRVRDPRPVQGAGRAADRRLASSSSRPKRWSPSTSTPGATPARRTPRRPSSAPTSRRPARSPGRSGCGTSAASSSATSSTWRPAPTATRCSRSCAPTWAGTAPAPRRSPCRSWAWSR